MPEMTKKLIAHIQLDIYGDFSDSIGIWQEFLAIVNSLPDVTVINSIKHDFPGGGFSGLILIAESHAAIHTWPEYYRAWVELATCGDPKSIEIFKNKILEIWKEFYIY